MAVASRVHVRAMGPNNLFNHTCPKCGSDAAVIAKLLLIGKVSPGRKIENLEEFAGYQRQDQLAADECLPEFLRGEPQRQFVDGYFCKTCEVGFVPNEYLKAGLNK